MLETGDYAYVGFEMFARLCKRLCSAVHAVLLLLLRSEGGDDTSSSE